MAKTATQSKKKSIVPAKTLAAFKKHLESERDRILDLYNQNLKEGKRTTNQGAEDLVDQANQAYNRELLLSISTTEREQIKLIDQALDRIDDGSFGVCLYSGEPIGLPRLEAVPWARYTIDVQEKVEKGLIEEEPF